MRGLDQIDVQFVRKLQDCVTPVYCAQSGCVSRKRGY